MYSIFQLPSEVDMGC